MEMLHLNSEIDNPHHEAGLSRVLRDADPVIHVIAAVEINPYTEKSAQLFNIYSGQHALLEVQHDLTQIRKIGYQALTKSIDSPQQKTHTVRLNTFQTQNKIKRLGRTSTGSGKSDEVTALPRMTQIVASGGEVDEVKDIERHECSNIPQSLFDDKGKMRSGNKAIMVKAIKDDTKVGREIKLPISAVHTAVIVDAMSMIRRLSFKKGDAFVDISNRFRQYLISNITQGTHSIHFCCDRYWKTSMKADERHNRSGKLGSAKVYGRRPFSCTRPRRCFCSGQKQI